MTEIINTELEDYHFKQINIFDIVYPSVSGTSTLQGMDIAYQKFFYLV